MRYLIICVVALLGCFPSSPAPSGSAADATTADPDAPNRPEDSPHLGLGIPTDATPDDDLLLVHAQFVAGYSQHLNAANWVSWRTRPEDFGPVPRYEGDFYPDDRLPADWFHPDTDIYYGPGYDRGHMLRSEERTDTVAHNIETFVMTNVLPQTADLNRGVWFDFEQYLQYKVKSPSQPQDAYVLAGGVWSPACATHVPRTAGDGCADIGRVSDPMRRVAVPVAYWKIVAFVPAGTAFSGESATVVAVMMPNIDGVQDHRWWQYRSTVAEIEMQSGYDIPAL
jgi:endonuclease G